MRRGAFLQRADIFVHSFDTRRVFVRLAHKLRFAVSPFFHRLLRFAQKLQRLTAHVLAASSRRPIASSRAFATAVTGANTSPRVCSANDTRASAPSRAFSTDATRASSSPRLVLTVESWSRIALTSAPTAAPPVPSLASAVPVASLVVAAPLALVARHRRRNALQTQKLDWWRRPM